MKTVLIISYYWPPSGGGGVQRWLKFTKYLPEEGWHCVVCTPENPSFDLTDSALEDEVHPDTEVLKLPIWEPYSFFKRVKGEKQLEQGVMPAKAGPLSRFIRGNFFIPDPRRFWVGPTVRFLRQFLKDRPVDVIVTTGPPHSMHLIGLKLHKKTKIPWLADFRDPWSRWDMLNEFKVTLPARQLHKSMERRVFRHATGLLTVSEQWADEFAEMHGRRPEVITNGFDPDDFSHLSNPSQEAFVMVHAGLLNSFRFAPAFWRAASRVLANGQIQGRVIMKGMIDPAVLSSVRDLISDNYLSTGPSVPHEEVIRLYQDAGVLLLFMNRSENASGHIPGKLFEYLAANRWILAVGDPEGEVNSILRETGSGKVLHWDDESGIAQALNEFYNKYRQGIMPESKQAEQFSRKVLSKELTSFMDRLSDGH